MTLPNETRLNLTKSDIKPLKRNAKYHKVLEITLNYPNTADQILSKKKKNPTYGVTDALKTYTPPTAALSNTARAQ